MKRYVLKISGHLMRYPDILRQLVITLYEIYQSNTALIALVPGGSEFADLVKDLQARVGFNDDIAHWMAIKAMEVYGSYISNAFPDIIKEVTNLREVMEKQGKIPLIMPYEVIRRFDELPHSWSVTSDSIALYLTYKLSFDMTILAKVIDGIALNGKIVRRIRVIELKDMDIVDTYIKALIEMTGKNVAIFNARKPWILNSIINNIDDEYTLITP